MRRRHSFATILVGKNSLLREGLVRILRSENFRILASVSSPEDLLATKLQAQQPLFLIVHTADDFEIVAEQIELFRGYYPGARIAIVADRYRIDELISAFRAGANGYFVDVVTCDVFIKSLELVMMGETVFPPAFLSFVLESDRIEEVPLRDEGNQAILVTAENRIVPQLSPREKSILQCLIDGDSNKSIARKIDIAEATVKVHVKAILRKIRVHNRTQAAIWGMNNGWLTQTSDANSPPLAPAINKHIPIAAVSEIEQTSGSVKPDVIEGEATHVEVPRLERLIRKGSRSRK